MEPEIHFPLPAPEPTMAKDGQPLLRHNPVISAGDQHERRDIQYQSA